MLALNTVSVSEYVTTKVDGVTCKMIRCLTCGKLFENSNKMKKHLITHTRELPWSCDVRGEKHTTKSILKTHKSHAIGIDQVDQTEFDKLYPYWCSYCSRGFSGPTDLSMYGRRHTWTKPLLCCVCEHPLSLKRTMPRDCNTEYGKQGQT